MRLFRAGYANLGPVTGAGRLGWDREASPGATGKACEAGRRGRLYFVTDAEDAALKAHLNGLRGEEEPQEEPRRRKKAKKLQPAWRPGCRRRRLKPRDYGPTWGEAAAAPARRIDRRLRGVRGKQ
jgi:hypothetical protein